MNNVEKVIEVAMAEVGYLEKSKIKNEKLYTLYCHVNKFNGKLYIGITSTSMYMRHRNGRGYYTQLFGRAIRKYGWNSFEHIILLENLPHDIACECEKYLIAKYHSNNPSFGYNVTEGGEGNSCKNTEESNRKRSEAERGEKHWHYGQKWSPEVIKKLHKPHPSVSGDNSPTKRPEVRAKISEKLKLWHKEHPDFKPTLGYDTSHETKLKISKANRGENNGNYGKKWFTDGTNNILAFECPTGYRLGRTNRRREYG